MQEKSNTSTTSHTDTCVICLHTISNRAIISPCNHLTFDLECLVSWTKQRSTCPLCTSPITRIEYDWRSPTDYKIYNIPRPQCPESKTLSITTRRPRIRRRYNQQSRDSPQDVLVLRRRVYTSSALSLYRRPLIIITPDIFHSSSLLQSRARTFLRRDLSIFEYLKDKPGRLEWVVEYIIGMLCRLEIKGTDGQLERLVGEILGKNSAKVLIHDLQSWLSGSWTKLEDWDRVVQYNELEVVKYNE